MHHVLIGRSGIKFHRIEHFKFTADAPHAVIVPFLIGGGAIVMSHAGKTGIGRTDSHLQVQVRIGGCASIAYDSKGISHLDRLSKLDVRRFAHVAVQDIQRF